jgi:hypothetical protein
LYDARPVALSPSLWVLPFFSLPSWCFHYFFFFFATAILSIKLGYGLPALLALDFASVFCAGVSFVDFDFGFFVSHTGVVVLVWALYLGFAGMVYFAILSA